MNKKIAFLVCLIAACCTYQANASVMSFTQADMLGMAIDSSVGAGSVYSGLMFPGPGVNAYEDDVFSAVPSGRLMRGQAGSTATVVGGGNVFYTLTGASLAAFTSTATSADSLRMVGYNDNDDDWTLGIWYRTAAGEVITSSGLASGEANTFNLDLTDGITEVGVFVANTADPTLGTDTFHASWIAPEPGTIAIWSILGVVGLTTSRRRRA